MEAVADMTFGLHHQALAVAQFLAGRAPDFAQWKDGRYEVRCETASWYNGRERGVLFSMSPGVQYPWIHIAVFEHRNSDEVCAVRWTEDCPRLNPPTIADVPDEAYPNKYSVSHSVSWGHIGEMADWVYRAMEEHYAASVETAS